MAANVFLFSLTSLGADARGTGSGNGLLFIRRKLVSSLSLLQFGSRWVSPFVPNKQHAKGSSRVAVASSIVARVERSPRRHLLPLPNPNREFP